MNIEQFESNTAEILAMRAKRLALAYTENEADLDAATVALLWAAFEMEAKRFGLTEWRGLTLE
jgi:hypothetical protein